VGFSYGRAMEEGDVIVPHGILGLGWSEVVSLGTLIVVVANYFKTSISHTAHESSKKDLQDLNEKLIDFKFNVSKLTALLTQLNKDTDELAKHVATHDKDIEDIKIDLAKLKEKIGAYKNDHSD
jgi:peptidoglycan hydrolase CwlO-like protein